MQKIIIIGSAYPLRGGGIATFNERLAEELQSSNNKVSIYSFSLQYPSLLFPGRSQYSTDPAPKHLNIHSVINSINPLNWFKVAYKIIREKPDLVIIGWSTWEREEWLHEGTYYQVTASGTDDVPPELHSKYKKWEKKYYCNKCTNKQFGEREFHYVLIKYHK